MELDIPGPGDHEKDAMATSLENGQSEHGHSHMVNGRPGKKRGSVATVAWMVMIGDVIHNFVDGMAIGAAFTENVFLGVSIGIAVLCEELPHELGALDEFWCGDRLVVVSLNVRGFLRVLRFPPLLHRFNGSANKIKLK